MLGSVQVVDRLLTEPESRELDLNALELGAAPKGNFRSSKSSIEDVSEEPSAPPFSCPDENARAPSEPLGSPAFPPDGFEPQYERDVPLEVPEMALGRNPKGDRGLAEPSDLPDLGLFGSFGMLEVVSVAPPQILLIVTTGMEGWCEGKRSHGEEILSEEDVAPSSRSSPL